MFQTFCVYFFTHVLVPCAWHTYRQVYRRESRGEKREGEGGRVHDFVLGLKTQRHEYIWTYTQIECVIWIMYGHTHTHTHMLTCMFTHAQIHTQTRGLLIIALLQNGKTPKINCALITKYLISRTTYNSRQPDIFANSWFSNFSFDKRN